MSNVLFLSGVRQYHLTGVMVAILTDVINMVASKSLCSQATGVRVGKQQGPASRLLGCTHHVRLVKCETVLQLSPSRSQYVGQLGQTRGFFGVKLYNVNTPDLSWAFDMQTPVPGLIFSHLLLQLLVFTFSIQKSPGTIGSGLSRAGFDESKAQGRHHGQSPSNAMI